MKKAITSEYGTHNNITVIERANWSISFYDAETGRHYTRRVWYPIFGSTIYVQHRGGFYSIATEYAGKYDPQAISRYETVSADELKSMTAEIIAHRAGKQYADELTWEETTRVYAYAVICNDADTEATMTAIVNGILQNRDEQPEPATIEATEPEPEQTGEHMPIIYATERTEATEPAPFEAEVQEWDTLLIQIDENELVETRTGERYTDGYRYTLYTVSKFGNLFVHYGFTGHGKTSENCLKAANRMLGKYFNRRTSEVVATGATLEAMHASITDETVYERFKMWAAGLFTDAPDPEPTSAARAFIDAYAEAIGDAVTDDDPEARAAYRVARDEIAGGSRSTDQERETVADMLEAIAAKATETTAQQVAELARDIRYDLQLTTFGPKDIEEARALTNRYADLTADVMEALGTSHVCDRTLVCIAHAMEASGYRLTDRDDADQDADPAPLYQRAELDAYLGDYSDDYDVDAIEAEATEYDPKTGRRTWRPNVDLWEVCERHEIAEYRPAIA